LAIKTAENNWIRRIVGLKRGEKSRIDEVRVEVGVKEIVGFDFGIIYL